MKIETIGCEYYDRDKNGTKVVRKPGEPFEVDDKEAERLINMGVAKEFDGKPAELPKPDPKPETPKGDKK